jgi:hypothetical protein
MIMSIDQFNMAVVDWLEELPLEEITNEDCRFLISEFREGFIEVTEAIAILEHDFSQDIEQWIETNNFLSSLQEE